MIGTIELTAGRQPSAVVESLRPLILQGSNLVRGGIGIDVLQNQYLQWLESVERTLRELFDSSWVWGHLHSPRWMQIVSLTSDTPRPYPLINGEVEAQTQHLIGLADRLESLFVPFELPPTCLAIVPDTNVFLHYQQFDMIAWRSVTTAEQVRLVIPLLVVEELDNQKFSNRVAALRQRARRALKAMRAVRAGLPPTSAAEVAPGIGLQILMDPPRHERNPNSDEEILDRASSIGSFVGGQLFVATGDFSMELRAIHRGMKSLALPPELAMSESDDA